MFMARRRALIAFMSDFGADSIYPGIAKGVIQRINPDASVVDLTHSVPPFDVLLGALFLSASVRWFPEGTLFLSVVDPGVGGKRKPLIIVTKKYVFIGPDNGLMYPAARDDGVISAYRIKRGKYTYDTGCETFHGRDVFAPVAAHVSLGVSPDMLGNETDSPVQLELPGDEIQGTKIEGRVLYTDPFGNVVTSILSSRFQSFAGGASEFIVSGMVGLLARTYEEVRGGFLGIIPGSFDRIEISLKQGNAASLLSLKRGDPIGIEKK